MNLNPTDDRIKNKANNLFEPIFDELLQLSVWQHVVVAPKLFVPGEHAEAHIWVITPANVVFYKKLKILLIL